MKQYSHEYNLRERGGVSLFVADHNNYVTRKYIRLSNNFNCVVREIYKENISNNEK